MSGKRGGRHSQRPGSAGKAKGPARSATRQAEAPGASGAEERAGGKAGIRLPPPPPAQSQGPRPKGYSGGKGGRAMPDAERQLGRSRKVH